MTWRLWWEHTAMLVEEAHGGCDYDLTEISRAEAEQIAAELAARYWPPDAARLPLGRLCLSSMKTARQGDPWWLRSTGSAIPVDPSRR